MSVETVCEIVQCFSGTGSKITVRIVKSNRPFLVAAVLDISYVKNMDNAATTAVTEAVKVAEKSIEECRVVAARAEDNYRAWYIFVIFIILILRQQCRYYILYM
jgi:NAD-specific glutamate dehydrogenase